ncbi:flagellar assembly protein H [Pseudolabrys taiwanensis]|uniref:Flagellar assembly protein FliH n=1 Tax=Pseudolabrys taiwanensis TaxID=331696 RepID=A0A345ZW37_9HYPH|nr:FliH/SctL family protein [Pseudolabrys taiwanensis]AXK81134.1 flagellar assembly protein H [Pseudolabrys taiwanensis]
MTKATAKFLFDEDFATGAKPTITVVEAERRRADAESQAYRKGFAAGEIKAQGEATQRVAGALAVIADGLDRLNRALAGIEARLETEAVDVAVAVASKLAPELIAREPFAEISALATDCFRQIVTTPHIVVRVSADIHEMTKEKLEEIAASRGFEGRLLILADAELAAGDCRIEWSEGGINRDREATLNTINEAVARYVAARVVE